MNWLIAVLAIIYVTGSAVNARSADVAASTLGGVSDVYSAGRALVKDFDKVVSPNGVQDSFNVKLGGANQYVSVRGSDRRNPVLLYIHGGPVSVELPIS